MTCTSHDTYFKTITRRALGCALSLLVGATLAISTPLVAAENAKSSASELSRDSHAALAKLLASDPAAKKLSAKAHAILVFPSVTKAGFMIGGQYGEGALIKNGRTIAYYNTAGASYGFQAGVQVYGYAMFFMNEKSLADLNKTEGFEIGTGPSLVVMDEKSAAYAKTISTSTISDDIYAFIFNQKGLMAGVGLQGNKITKINAK